MRHRRMLAPINSEKHYVQTPEFVIAASAISNVTVANAVQVLDKDATNEVEEGSVIKAIWLEYWIVNNGAGTDFGVMSFEKRPGGTSSMTFVNSNNLQAYPNKRNILWTFEGLLPPNTQNPLPVIRRWILIPKGKQRMGFGERLVMNFSGAGDGMKACGFSTYKEYK